MKRMRELLFGCMLMTLPAFAQEKTIDRKIGLQQEGVKTIDLLKSDKGDIEFNTAIPLMNVHPLAIEMDSVQRLQTDRTPIQYFPPSDYRRTGIFPFYKSLFIYLEGEQQTYQGLLSYTSVGGALGWRINKHFVMTAGVLALKQVSGIIPSVTERSGVNFGLTYSVNEKLDFSVWGQSLTEDRSALPNYANLLVPQTGAGASATLKVGQNSRIGVTTQYQERDQQGKWNYESEGKLQVNF